MPRLRAPAVSALIALLGLALPAGAAPAPIVFDFEDGLQGWELQGSAQRVQTQVLGGEWAIFGDGFAGDEETLISREIDLTGISSISIERFIVNNAWIDFALLIDTVSGALLVGPILSTLFLPDPNLWTHDLRGLDGVRQVRVLWELPTLIGEPDRIVAFIDNITFHPVPEPSTLVLVAPNLTALVIARRWMM